MSQLDNFSLPVLKFHTTQPYPCSYLPEKSARSQVATPDHLIDTSIYAKLIQTGFRRSGNYTYRPCCDQCQACLPIRILINQFTPNRTQRRASKRHQHLIAKQCELHYQAHHFALYQRYQAKRHDDNDMDYQDHEQYCNFLLQSNVDSKLIEFYEYKQLRMVSIIDLLPDGLSSVYTFFDPDLTNTSFGTYNILWQIEQCRKLGLTYLYLGYWIKKNQKMSYKINFQPLEVLFNGQWQPFTNLPFL